MKQLNYESNPLVAYLNQETLKPTRWPRARSNRSSCLQSLS